MHVFLSYSRRDGAFVRGLAADLERRGIDVWLDTEDLVAPDDDQWRRSIVQGIRQSAALVVVLSPHSVQSVPVERELTIAAEHKRRIIPIVLRPCELPDGFQFELAGVQRIDFVEQPYDEALDELVHRIGHVPSTAPPLPPPTPAPPVPVDRRWLVVSVAVAVAVVATVGVVALTGGGGDGGDEASAETTAAGDTSRSTTSPTTTSPTTTTDPGDAAARALVEELEGAYNARDWDAVRRLNPNQGGWTDEQFDSGYADLRQAFHHVLRVEPDGGTVWDVVGAIVAWDVATDGGEVTNVACIEWATDVAAGTVAQSSYEGNDGRTRRPLTYWPPEEQIPAIAAQYCG